MLREPTISFNVKDYKLDKVIQLISENCSSGINFETELGFILNPAYEDKVDLMIKLDAGTHKNIWDNHNGFYNNNGYNHNNNGYKPAVVNGVRTI